MIFMNNTFVYESPRQENLVHKCWAAIESLHEEIEEEWEIWRQLEEEWVGMSHEISMLEKLL